jgi:diguanylate cyclase (GGDEF)-like protein/PAS domain S-box-containing protein
MLLPVFTLSLLGAMWAAVFHQLDTERASTRKEATVYSQALARSLGDHVSHILRQTDHATQLFKLKFEESGGRLRLPEFARRDGLLDSVLPSALSLPMALYGRDGIWIDSANAIVPDDVSQMPFFRTLAADRRNVSLFNTHVVDPRTRKWHIQIARRLNDGAGQFAGVIIVMVDPMYFVDDYERLNLHEHDVMALFHGEAGLAAGKAGKRLFIDDKLRVAARAEAGAAPGEVTLAPAFDATPRIYAANDMPRFGLMAVVGVNEHGAMERYRRHESTYTRGAAIASVAIVLVSLLLMRQSAQLRASMREARTAQATLRAASDGSLDALVIFRAACDAAGQVEDFIIVDTNERAAAMLHVPRADLLGRPAFATLPRLRRTGFMQTFARVLETGMALEEEVELRFDGEAPLWVHHQIVPLKDGVAVTSRDITQRKLAEIEIRSNRSFLQSLIDHLPLLIYVKSVRPASAGTMVVWNKAAEKMTGYPAAEVIGNTDTDAFAPELNLTSAAADQAMLARPEVRDEPEIPIRGADGITRYVHALAVPLVDEHGTTEYILGIAEDITRRREQEQELRSGEAQLRESEARLRTIADTMPAMVAYVDAQQVYRFHNLAYGREFGREGMAVPGRTVQDTMGEARYRYLQPYIERVLAGETLVFEEQDQGKGQDQPGNAGERTFEVTYIPQLGEDEETVVGFHVMRQDISSQQREKKRLLRLAQIDPLTGLANRAGFLAKLDAGMRECAAHGRLMAVMYLDIDRFKPVNDTFGHAVGDKLLKAFAGRLTHALRDSDTVARLGGDEFTIVMEHLQRETDAQAAAAKIVAAMRAPFELDGVSVSISTSIGVTYYRGGAHDPDALLKEADMLLYQAKQAGRDTFRAAARTTARTIA